MQKYQEMPFLGPAASEEEYQGAFGQRRCPGHPLGQVDICPAFNTFVTLLARDPRAIVDYSDVDSFAVVDFDF